MLVSLACAASCTPQQIYIDKPCPPVEYPVINAPATTPPPSAAATPRTLEIRLTPVRNEGRSVIAVDVAMRFSVPPVDFGDADPIVLRLDPHIAGAATGDRIDDLEARDSEGSLALRRSTDVDSGKPARAAWKSERRARGPVTVSYRVQLLAEDAARDEVLATAGGVFAIGRALFLMPATTEPHTIHALWDLAALDPGAEGTSSFGLGEADVEGPPSILEQTIWMAGPIEEMAIRSPATNSAEGGQFRLITLGKGNWDVTEVGPWTNRAWLSVRTVATQTNDFGLFVRPTGKTGSRFDLDVFGRSVIATTDNEVKFTWPEKLRLTEAMVRAARGSNVMNQRWFDNGFGTYLALDGLRKTGLAAPADIAAELTKRSERYFAAPWLRTPLAGVMDQKDEPAGLHIEDRGFFAAAEIDAKLRLASAGKKSLFDFVRALEPAAPAATDTTDVPKTNGVSTTAFAQALEKELGAEAMTRHRNLVETGSAIADVPDDTFGPCFKKAKKKIQREDSATKKRESVDGFTFSVVPKLPPHCGNVVAAPKADGNPKHL